MPTDRELLCNSDSRIAQQLAFLESGIGIRQNPMPDLFEEFK